MKTSFRAAIVVTVFLTTAASQLTAFAQGGLTPPGAPAPTMKSLDQVEPRTPITSFPFTINQSGSYDLTRSVSSNFAGLYVIGIFTNDVTVDLCGFTLRHTGTNAIAGFYLGPGPNSFFRNIHLMNGTLSGYGASAAVGGFAPRNCLYENLTVADSSYGFLIQSNGTAAANGNVIRNCRIIGCDTGIEIFTAAGTGNVIDHCDAFDNTNTAFRIDCPGNLIVNCRAAGNAFNYGIVAGNRSGLWVVPATNSSTIFPPTAGPGSGTTDPFANLGY